MHDLLTALIKFGKSQKIYYLWRPNLKDENDNLFVELAIASGSQYLITNNVRDFKSGELKTSSFEFITPYDFWKVLRSKNG